MSAAVAVAIGIGTAVASLGASIFGSSSSNKRAKRAEKEKKRLTGELDQLEKNRQAIINPYEGVTDLSSMVSDLSTIASNPFDSLSVSTAGAEMQAEQTDLALANTLDTLRSTGASAGGATALARMALESKKGVSASIEQQEAQNQKLRASGEERVQNVKLSEAQRVQGELRGEATRMQDVDVKGKDLMFRRKEEREMQQLDRKQAQITGAAAQQASATQAKADSINAGISAVGNIASSTLSAVAGAKG